MPPPDLTTPQPSTSESKSSRRNLISTAHITSRRNGILSHMVGITDFRTYASQWNACPANHCSTTYDVPGDASTLSSTAIVEMEARVIKALEHTFASHQENPVKQFHVYIDPNQVRVPIGHSISW